MKLYVLDASVAAKWVLPGAGEPLVKEALELLKRDANREIEFIVPDFFWAELGNTLWKAVQRGRWSSESATEALRECRSWRLRAVPASELIDEALSIAIAAGRTVYDSLYVALAIRSRAEFVTADERLVNALAGRFPVRWLGIV